MSWFSPSLGVSFADDEMNVASPGSSTAIASRRSSSESVTSNAGLSHLNKMLHNELVHLKAEDIRIQQNNPNSPLFSVKSFKELRLPSQLLDGVYGMGFSQPSKIQESALPVLLIDPPQNMIAQSQSGTGKTAAFVLTMLYRIQPENAWPQCICLTPTYELALQIGKVVEQMSKYMAGVQIGYALRGGRRVARGDQLHEQILIGTPGTMLDWMTRFKVFDVSKINVFVLDEADVMISQQGHQDQSLRAHRAIMQANSSCQCLLFSATYDDSVMKFAEDITGPDACMITVRREEQTVDNIRQFYVRCPNRESKLDAILNLYGALTIGSAIIFCHTKVSAEWLAKRMQEHGHDVLVLTSNQDIQERAQRIQDFTKGLHKVLITTNVCARGIDVKSVTIVINYDLPMLVDVNNRNRPTGPDFETYLHRIGRTGRFGKAGLAINLVDSDQSLEWCLQIGNHFSREIQPLDTSNTDQLDALDNDA